MENAFLVVDKASNKIVVVYDSSTQMITLTIRSSYASEICSSIEEICYINNCQNQL